MYFSKECLSFYPDSLVDSEFRPKLPGDLVKVTDNEVIEYSGTQPPEGKVLSGDDNGHPCWIDVPLPPAPSPEQEKKIRIAEIKKRLTEIDTESVRPLRAIRTGNSVAYDDDKLALLDDEATELRSEIAILSS